MFGVYIWLPWEKNTNKKTTGGCAPSSQRSLQSALQRLLLTSSIFLAATSRPAVPQCRIQPVKGKRGGGQPPPLPPPAFRRVNLQGHRPPTRTCRQRGWGGGNTLTIHPAATLERNDSFDYTFQTTAKSCRAAIRGGLAGSRIGLMNHAT